LKVTYTSSNESVATVDATGAVTPVAVGTTTITAKSDETETYDAGEASYTLTVKDNTDNTVFTETFDQCGGKGGNDGNWSGSIATSTLTADNTGWIFNAGYGASKCAKIGGSSTQGSAKTPSISLTGNGTLTFKAGAWAGDATTLNISASGAKLSKSSVTLEASKFTDYSIDITNATGSVTITFTGLKPSKKSKGRFFLDEVKVTKTSTKTATQLTFTNTGDKTFTQGDTDGLTFTNAATLTPAVDGATITYSSSDKNIATVDETGKVSVKTDNTGSATITATYAGDDTYASSTASYKITVYPKLTGAGNEANPYTVADVVALNKADLLPTDSAYVKGIISEVGDFNSKYGEVTYYISDDGTTTNQLYVYQGLGPKGDKFTAATDLQTGWTVVVKGKLKVYNSTLEFNYGSKITSLTKPVSYTKATLTGFAQSGNDYYATFSSDQVTFFPNDVTVYGVVVENNQLTMTSGEEDLFTSGTVTIDDKEVKGYYVPANTGVLINAIDASVTYYTVANKTVDAIDNRFNMLYPASKAMSDLGDSYYFYKLAYDDYSAKTGLGFYWGADNGTVFTAKTNGAYLAVPKTASAKSAFRFDGTTTGVNTISAKTTTNDVIYNIQGQRVGANYKGLVIVNGKKMMRK